MKLLKLILSKTFILKIYTNYKQSLVTNGSTKLNVLKTFPLFEAHGWGLYSIRAKLTIQSINQVIPSLSEFAKLNKENIQFKEKVLEFLIKEEYKEKLGSLFTFHGSDKATIHDYYLIYASIINDIQNPNIKIFEIGLGTNNTDVVSTMGTNGKPGASLRAFRDYIDDSYIYGADFDHRILFEEKRIKTFFVDQTNPKTFSDLSKKINLEFDLMIDDGLHSPNANLNSLAFFKNKIKSGGYIVIEDVNPNTEKLWLTVSNLLEREFKSAFINTKAASVFILQKK